MNLIERFQSYADQKKWADALDVIDEILMIAPDIDTSWFNKGVCLDELGRHNEAAEAFIKAQEKNINDIGIHYRIIRSLQLAENFGLLFDFINYSCSIEPEILNALLRDSDFKEIVKRPEFLEIQKKYYK